MSAHCRWCGGLHYASRDIPCFVCEDFVARDEALVARLLHAPDTEDDPLLGSIARQIATAHRTGRLLPYWAYALTDTVAGRPRPEAPTGTERTDDPHPTNRKE